ncbi:hypothetical protein H5410_001056 [Solanum commersonii]|uniref:Uncharacterized protein n=1 Tax=Solanum commersonii TaxID=4109 RepID=A0A9J6AYP0_SOLCO|nr:hypothetical protein H5410_001056 [Solanum commersonii]
MNAHNKTQFTYARINRVLKDSNCDTPSPKILMLAILATCLPLELTLLSSHSVASLLLAECYSLLLLLWVVPAPNLNVLISLLLTQEVSRNQERAIVSAKGTASPVQTVAGKDSSNPLMADTLPKVDKQKDKGIPTKKKKKRIEKIIKNSLCKLLKEKTKEIIQENPKPEPTNSDLEDTRSRSDENDLSIDQFTQYYDLNEDNDSGISFDSEALHNLDT